jgi:hypothetical protein
VQVGNAFFNQVDMANIIRIPAKASEKALMFALCLA